MPQATTVAVPTITYAAALAARQKLDRAINAPAGLEDWSERQHRRRRVESAVADDLRHCGFTIQDKGGAIHIRTGQLRASSTSGLASALSNWLGRAVPQ
jgi:hypothetical protein